MAIRVDANGDALSRTADLLNYNANYTWMSWVYWTSNSQMTGGNYPGVLSLSNNTTSAYDMLLANANGNANGNWGFETAPSGLANSGNAIPIATWIHIAMVRVSVTNLILYVTGSQEINLTHNSVAGRTAVTRMDAGRLTDGAGNQNTTLRIAAQKIWSTNLSQAEIQNEIWSVVPRRAANLYGWWPGFPGATERLADYSANGRNWTADGTLSDEDGPPVDWRLRLWSIPFVQTGGSQLSFAAILTAGSATPDNAGLAITRPFTATASQVSTTPAPNMAVARNVALLATAVSATPDAALVASRAMLASLAAGSATPNSALVVTRQISAAASGATATPAVNLGVAMLFASGSTAVSATPDVATLAAGRAISAVCAADSGSGDVVQVVIQRNLATLLEAGSSTPATELRISRIMSAISTAASVTPQANLGVAMSIAAAIGAESQTADSSQLAVARIMISAAASNSSTSDQASLGVARITITAMAGQSATPEVSIVVARATIGILTAISNTADPAMPVSRQILSALTAVSAVSDEANLSIAGAIELAATLLAQSNTPDALMAVARSMVAAAAPGSATPLCELAVARPAGSIVLSVSSTPDTASLVAGRALASVLQAVSATPIVQAQIARIMQSQNLIQSQTPAASVAVSRPMALTSLAGSATPTGTIIVVARAAAGSATAASYGSDTAELGLGAIILIAVLTAQSQTSSVSWTSGSMAQGLVVITFKSARSSIQFKASKPTIF